MANIELTDLASYAANRYLRANSDGTALEFDALTSADVGLSNVDNTSDATKNAATATLTNKTINLASNTLTGTTAEFNTALSDGNFATLAGIETLTNKSISLTSNTVTGTMAEFNTACSDGNFIYDGGALGTPSSGTLTNCTGYTVANLSGLGSGVGTFLATPSSANFFTALSDETTTGTGAWVFATAPVFPTKITIGAASGTTGSIELLGTTSGTVTLKPADIAGTYTLTLPATDGDASQVLTTDGSGVLSWTTPASTTPGGSNTQIQFNNSGAFGGISTLTWDGATLTNSKNSALSAPVQSFTGTWITGGTATTTKPHVLIEPTGTTSTGWSTGGTGLGINAASGFTGFLISCQVNGSSRFRAQADGDVHISGNTYIVGFVQSSQLSIGAKGRIQSPSDSILTLVNNAATDFGRLQFGGTTSSFPALKRSSAALQIRLADDSAYASLECASLTIADGSNIVLNTTTGTKIGTATTQKLSLWNATPIVQPTTAVTAATFTANTSAIADDTATFDGYTIGQVVKALRNIGILA